MKLNSWEKETNDLSLLDDQFLIALLAAIINGKEKIKITLFDTILGDFISITKCL